MVHQEKSWLTIEVAQILQKMQSGVCSSGVGIWGGVDSSESILTDEMSTNGEEFLSEFLEVLISCS